MKCSGLKYALHVSSTEACMEMGKVKKLGYEWDNLSRSSPRSFMQRF